jgi:hypothetical protein
MRFRVFAAAAALIWLLIACGAVPQARPAELGVHQATFAAQPAQPVAAEAVTVAQPAPEAQSAAAPSQGTPTAAGSTGSPAEQVPGGRCNRPGVPPALCPVP